MFRGGNEFIEAVTEATRTERPHILLDFYLDLHYLLEALP